MDGVSDKITLVMKLQNAIYIPEFETLLWNILDNQVIMSVDPENIVQKLDYTKVHRGTAYIKIVINKNLKTVEELKINMQPWGLV
jgi:hypothetical protein